MNYSKYVQYLLILCIGAWGGFFLGTQWFPRTETRVETIEVERPIIVQGEARTETKTQIAYVPKETVVVKYVDASTGQEVTAQQRETVDLDAQIGKPDFVVRLNGKETTFAKADDEAYMFERNKIALEQSSTITIDARVEPQVIDDTRRWSIGVGYGDHGVAYKVDFPLGHGAWGGWAYRDNSSKAGGVALRF